MKPLRLFALCCLLAACGPNPHEVGGFSNDLLGNEIKIEALPDPDIPNVICHVAHFDRSVFDRLRQGNWFENPSNSSVSCQRIGPVDLSHASLARGGEDIFDEALSPFFKRAALRRIVDLDHRTLLYVSYSRELIEGSAKMNISTVALTPEEVAAVRAPARR